MLLVLVVMVRGSGGGCGGRIDGGRERERRYETAGGFE